MADRVVTARTPGGQLVALPVVDLPSESGEELVADVGAVPDLAPAIAAIEDFSAALRQAVAAVAPRKATVEFSLAFGLQPGRVIALFVDAKAEGAVKVTLEWGGAGDE
jgi:Trypsin-co-occurring domain 1